MTAEQFKAWRKGMGFTQVEAAEALGLSKWAVINYEAGVRRSDGLPAVIPKMVGLACAAISAGLGEWSQPDG